MLNSDQFDSVKAGDWFCCSCKGSEASTGFKYFWASELKSTSTPKRKVAFSFGATSTCTFDQLLKETNTTIEDYVFVPVIKDGKQVEVLIPKKLNL